MSEFLSVMKTLLIASIVTMLMQVKWEGVTAEARAEKFLSQSQIAMWVQSAAAGGALALRNLTRSAKDVVGGVGAGFSEGAREQRAGR